MEIFRFLLMLGFLLVWGMPSSSAVSAPPTTKTKAAVNTERPTGNYQIARITILNKTGGEGPEWMVISLRDGIGTAAWLPVFAPAIDASHVRLADGQLTGQIMDRSPAHTPGIRFSPEAVPITPCADAAGGPLPHSHADAAGDPVLKTRGLIKDWANERAFPDPAKNSLPV